MKKFEIIIYHNGTVLETHYVEGERRVIEQEVSHRFQEKASESRQLSYELRPLSPLFSHVETSKTWKILKTIS
ncbi:MAG: hypothetical protein AAF518_03260 [Spirochaetota bacterium]